MAKYGLVLGRFQPFHNGHASIVDRVLSDKLIPIIVIGSANKLGPSNPFHPLQRMEMIKLLYPDAIIFCLDDFDDWDEWLTNLVESIKLLVISDLTEITVYTHNKPEDLQDFTFRGVEYTNEYYSKLFELDGMSVTNLPISPIPIRATTIRADLEGNKHFLNPLIYNYIKASNALD